MNFPCQSSFILKRTYSFKFLTLSITKYLINTSQTKSNTVCLCQKTLNSYDTIKHKQELQTGSPGLKIHAEFENAASLNCKVPLKRHSTHEFTAKISAKKLKKQKSYALLKICLS